MLLKSGLLFFSAIILSCGTTQNSTKTQETIKDAEMEVQKMEGEKMMAAGYLPGRIIYSEIAGDCEYTIQLKDGEKDFYYVDPINLNEEFMKDERTVWVKFNGLRRMNRCDKANPVEITEMKDRRE